MQAYALYVVAFVLGVYTNMRALENSNVETVIIFRSCTPLAVSVCDFVFLGRELPNRRSMAALLTIAAGRDESMIFGCIVSNRMLLVVEIRREILDSMKWCLVQMILSYLNIFLLQ